ncbi:hypothetical protein P154DRAFT_573488 [Amniculicola lignicola CBS 123094]|uniref:Ribonucleases P/MRP subunit Pop8-like domain-containing protein n=1 Tax=Amniculicola lignicola CBS 123094 TaxID=1392246 RepID=A0A6A5WPW2_9PLEO|nr:hypothetical protein P154DRAFT_573488 [Amniculicola lignicola CBS 123094]
MAPSTIPTTAATIATTSTSSNPTLPSNSNPTANHPSTNPPPSAPPNPPSADTEMLDAQDPATKKRKRPQKPHILHQTTFRNNAWTYLHLELQTPFTIALPASSSLKRRGRGGGGGGGRAVTAPSTATSTALRDLDPLTASTLLTPTLSAFLGLHGSRIPVDILKCEGRDVWIRVPREDGKGVLGALTGWMGWCEAGLVPGGAEGGEGENGRVRVSWRVRGKGDWLGAVVGEGDGDGGELFEG